MPVPTLDEFAEQEGAAPATLTLRYLDADHQEQVREAWISGTWTSATIADWLRSEGYTVASNAAIAKYCNARGWRRLRG